ncbi:ammonia-forming cytochrome c nitrite reductase subunit c552 [Desulfosporosinus sp.]|uniref:ammonia-forming cytochrome c nitrite reductase subunit c552 n=1 Tax=Desulfosporosinus sp. TaxID=157907 RepID=UPI00231192BE|nr:ammonia-forming cytochrome c nitrite reductase subunit c552 [Desulfosporosinus sp.]MCO5387759.1 ammonia-forming cytochrome c nitrite reductase subunit c552 [Desulfosporosinus sp.]MDA8224096.1 ammonia-forming cytochrome c nitrite reductase subunit c552 [Desulfitobacterium hafniense]
MNAEKAIVGAIEALTKATNDPKADPKLLEEARQLHRNASFNWDFVASENSMGFHNPTEALRVLGEAINLGHQATQKATQAMSHVQ